jgi:hypothetical protein
MEPLLIVKEQVKQIMMVDQPSGTSKPVPNLILHNMNLLASILTHPGISALADSDLHSIKSAGLRQFMP